MHDLPNHHTITIYHLGLKNQALLSRCLDHGFLDTAHELKAIDRHLVTLLQHKMAGDNSTRYVWRTQGDDKVRSSHGVNDGKIFAWDNPPTTGHPGEDYNCRCWAEPVDGNEYARQTLISSINDNPNKWTNIDLNNHYVNGSGRAVTLEEIGYLENVINHFANEVVTSDGSRGGYQAVEKQVIKKAKEMIEGVVDYEFGTTYEFARVFDVHYLLTGNAFYSLGESTVSGVFDGDVRKEKVTGAEYLVINGIMSYQFYDEFADRFQTVEVIDALGGYSREDAERIADELFGTESGGRAFEIVGEWRTKLTATVKPDK